MHEGWPCQASRTAVKARLACEWKEKKDYIPGNCLRELLSHVTGPFVVQSFRLSAACGEQLAGPQRRRVNTGAQGARGAQIDTSCEDQRNQDHNHFPLPAKGNASLLKAHGQGCV